MQKGRILGIDFGTKRIGFAVSDFDCVIALPVGFVEIKGLGNAVADFCEICKKYEIFKIVFGKPIGLNKQRGDMMAKIEEFGKLLKRKTDSDILFEDERFTSVQAGKVLKSVGIKEKRQRSEKDSIAAAILLQTYLDKINSESD